MFSHVMLGCSDRDRSRQFYDATLGALDIRPGRDFGKSDWWMTREGALGIGPPIDGQPCGHGNGLAYLRDPDGNKLCGYYRYPSE